MNPNEGSNPCSVSKWPDVIYETEGQKNEGKNPQKGRCHAGLTAWHLYSPKLMVEARGVEQSYYVSLLFPYYPLLSIVITFS
jgi:hypothetical protein